MSEENLITASKPIYGSGLLGAKSSQVEDLARIRLEIIERRILRIEAILKDDGTKLEDWDIPLK